jgi:hypothetical protein
MKTIRSVTWQGKRYEIVMEEDTHIVIQLPEKESFGMVSRLVLFKKDLGRFWQKRIPQTA